MMLEAPTIAFNQLLDQAYALIYLIDPADGQILWANQHGLRYLGYDASEVGDIRFFALLPPDHRSLLHLIVAQIRSGDTVAGRDVGFAITTKTGEIVWLSGSLQLTQQGSDATVLYGVFHDRTEAYRAENQLRERTDILQRFYVTSPLLMGIVELSERDILHLSDNQATADFFDTTCANMAERWATELGVPQAILDLWMEHYYLCVTQQKPIQFEYLHPSNTRSTWLSVMVTYIGLGNEGRPRCSYIAKDITIRKQIYAALTQKTDELDRFFSVTIDLLAIADTNGYFRRLNRQWEKTLGYPLDTIEGKPFLDFVHPDDIEATLQIVSTLESQTEVQYFVNRYRCADGAYRWIEWRAIPDGQLIYAAARDITSQMHANKALQQSEEQYRNIIETTMEGVCSIDQYGVVTFVNRRLANMLMATEDQLLGRSVLDLVAEPDRAQLAIRLAEGHHEISRQQSLRFYRQDGSIISTIVSSTPQFDPSGKFQGSIGLITDVTQLISTQEDLKRSELRLSSILNSSLDGIMAMQALRDEYGLIIDFEWQLINPAACKLFNINADILIGHRLLQRMPSNFENGLFEAYVNVVETGEPYYHEYFHQLDGMNLWLACTAVKLEDGFVVTLRDITNVKESELALQKANQQLEARVAELNQRNNEMVQLSEISDFLQACYTVQEACDTIAGLVVPLFPYTNGSVFLISPSRNRVELMTGWGNYLQFPHEFHPKDCWALRRGRPHVVANHQRALRCNHTSMVDNESQTLCLPLIAQGETVGLLHLNAQHGYSLSGSQHQLAQMVAEQLALAIANLQLRETLQQQSIRDSLTGLFNRRYLEETLNQEIVRSQRSGKPIAVIMIDVDHFKNLNDSYGHDAGDHVLQLIAGLIKDRIRGSDVAARYGGEELTLILPEMPLEIAQNRAEEIRNAIAQAHIIHRGQRINNVSASFGVAMFPQHGSTGASVLQSADAALYRAKAGGCNCVIIAP